MEGAELQGTPKQVEWANDIRARRLEGVRKHYAEMIAVERAEQGKYREQGNAAVVAEYDEAIANIERSCENEIARLLRFRQASEWINHQRFLIR